ncbi:MAG TPA: hypothetical protein VF648_07100 [Pyrinomonadaceae bacterium]|jgi:hypothetical protein
MRQILLILLLTVAASVAAQTPERGNDFIRLESFKSSENSDWADAIEAAFIYGSRIGGVNVQVACGKSYKVMRPVKLQARDGQAIHSVKFVGCGSDYEWQSGFSQIEYTGSGTDSAFDLRTVYGLRFIGIRFKYTNPGFTGRLIDNRHSLVSEGGTGGDSAYNSFIDCTFTGTQNAYNAILLDVGGGIISRIIDNHFLYGAVGIIGASNTPHGAGNNYAYVWRVIGNAFNFVNEAIRDPSGNWYIVNNTFEPNREGKVRALTSSCKAQCANVSALTFTNNYMGDGIAQQEPFIELYGVMGGTVANNQFYTNGSRVAIEVTANEGVTFISNDGRAFENFIETANQTSFGLTTISNKINAQEIVKETTAICSGCNILEPSKAGTAPRMSKISGTILTDYISEKGSVFDIAIGWKADNRHIDSAFIATTMDGAYGLLNGSLLLMAGKNHDAPVCLGSDNKLRACVNGQGFVSRVPVIVPDEQFSQRWKLSNEAVTKAAIYRIYKNQLADIETIVNNLVEAKLAEKAKTKE